MVDAVLMAGGGKEDLPGDEEVINKAFIIINGKTLLSYILDALSRSRLTGKVVVVGPCRELENLQRQGYDFTAVEEAGSMIDNLAAGMGLLPRNRPCLIVSGDIPLLNEAVLDGFIELCEPFDRDMYYPVLTRECCERSFPETQRTYLRLKEGCFTGGNIGLLQPAWFFANRDRLEMFVTYRKKPLRLLRLLSLGFFIKLLMRRLSIAELETKLSRIFDVSIKAVHCEFVEIGIDVDKPGDLDTVRRALSGQSAAKR